MLDHQCWISIPTTVAREPVFVSAVVLYSLAYNATDVMENDNLVTTLNGLDSDQHSADKYSKKMINR